MEAKTIIAPNNKEGTVTFVNGPVIKASNMRNFAMREVVNVGPKKLMGEIISMDGNDATIQVYEDTDGLRIYETVTGSGGRSRSHSWSGPAARASLVASTTSRDRSTGR